MTGNPTGARIAPGSFHLQGTKSARTSHRSENCKVLHFGILGWTDGDKQPIPAPVVLELSCVKGVRYEKRWTAVRITLENRKTRHLQLFCR
jgi:hypothetical protein